MYDNKFETKENEIWTKDKIKPQHIKRKEALAWVEGGTVFVGTVAFRQPLWQSIWNENRRFNVLVIYYLCLRVFVSRAKNDIYREGIMFMSRG